MKILIPAILIFMYLIVGYVVAAILLAIDFLDNQDSEQNLAMGTIFQPCFAIIGILFLIAKIINYIGKRIAVIPVSIALGIKYVLEKNLKEKEDESNSAS